MKTKILKIIDVLTYRKPHKSTILNLDMKNVSQQTLKEQKFVYKGKNQIYWADRACALACVSMITKKPLDKKLLSKAYQFGGYDMGKDIGWYHHALVKVLDGYGYKARLIKILTRNKIINYLKKGSCIMASVSGKLDSHMILIYGIKLKNNKSYFVYQDPASQAKTIDMELYNSVSFYKGLVVAN